MPKSMNQKSKLLHIQKILLEETDELHTITVNQIIAKLAERGIAAERKSIYDDIDTLQKFGLDVICTRSRSNAYFVGARVFELPELKLLVDAVEASKFITGRKSLELIKKLEQCTSKFQARNLHRQVFVQNRIKNMHESIYYNVDKLHLAITEKKQITFKYMEWTLDKGETVRKNGGKYCENPCALCWENDNYYLIAYNTKHGNCVHYRVDRMAEVEMLETASDFGDLQCPFDPVAYTKQYFGMFGGEVTEVTLQFANELIGVVIDRFGKNISIKKDTNEDFIIKVSVAVSPVFFGWLLGLGAKVKILGPEAVQHDMVKYCKKILNNYK
ncbi:MAG: WYL domain-containing protein [Acidaminococcaceae bacterium]